MTRKEFDTLKEGDEVILQCSGHLNGTKVVVRGCSDNGAVVIRMPQGWYSVYNYAKLRKQNNKNMTFEQTEERLLKLMKDMKASQGGMEYPILVDEDGQEFYVRDLVITEDRELIYEFRYMMDSESDWQLVIVPEEDIAAAITELEECFYE